MSPYRKLFAGDPKGKILLRHEILLPEKTTNLTRSLVFSIMGQQLSTQVAKVMQARFLELFGGKFPSAVTIRNTPFERIRGIGLSRSKTQYIHNVAEFIDEQKLTVKKLDKLTDEEVIALLTQIKGVGRWTVEMLLIFGLQREDLFALDDLGIQKGMIHLFRLEKLEKKELRLRMEKLSRRWSPYRSYACLHLWKIANSLPQK